MRGRIRSIKPEAHLDEGLWDLEQETGLPIFRAFVGLWNFSDRRGRFEWRPRALKAGILPYWEGDFSRVLDALTTRGFLVRYASQDGREYGWVRNFERHQVINNRESESALPDPAECEVISGGSQRVDDACPTRQVHAQAEGNGTEGNGTEHTRAREEPTTEEVHAAYIAGWDERHPSVKPHQRATVFDPLWQEVAQSLGSHDDLDRLMAAFWADDFCAETGHKPGALRSERARLLTQGPKTKRSGSRGPAPVPTEYDDDDPDEVWATGGAA